MLSGRAYPPESAHSLLAAAVVRAKADGEDLRFSVCPSVTEGESAVYGVCLTKKPKHDVTVTLTADTQLSVNPTSLTFTKDDWDTWQYVTLTAVEDAVVEGPHFGAVTHTVSSKDKDYDGLTRQLVVTVTDDWGTIDIRETDGGSAVTEGGASASADGLVEGTESHASGRRMTPSTGARGPCSSSTPRPATAMTAWPEPR